jgi:hypothetical protein
LAIPKVPASVTAPVEAVAGVKPVEPPEKDNTPELATVIVPDALVTVMPLLAVSVLRVYPVPLPINNWPLVGMVDSPVPPLVTGITPVPDPIRSYKL